MYMAKKAFTLLLCGLICAQVCSCGSDAEPDETTETDSSSDTTSEAVETEADPESVIYTDQLEKVDYSGETFRIYTSNSINSWTLPTTQNYAEEITGEVVNDALYNRDRWLEKNYGVELEYTIVEGSTTEMGTTLSNIILAGDDQYDLIIEDVAECARILATNGYMYALNEIDTINLDAYYWFPELNEELMIGDSLYFCASPISPRYYGSVYVIMFNRDYAAELQLEDVYALVENGTWTIDKLMELSRLGYLDLDGDSTVGNTEGEKVGFMYEILTPTGLTLGTGNHYVVNDGGELRVTLGDQNMVDLIQRIVSFFEEPAATWCSASGVQEYVLAESGDILFYNPCTFNLAEFRDYQYDYGILPMPKLDASQENYISYSQPWVIATPCIPITIVGDRLDMVGTLTDAMCAYGYDYIRPAVFENVIQLKGARDEKSAEIVDTMFENITFELTDILRFGSLSSTMGEFFTTRLGQQDITSAYAAIQSSTEAAIDELTSAFEGYEADRAG